MRNEIWSLISFLGAPSWFITLSPADVKHPICLYFADTGETFQPVLKGHDERYRLIANNPVAGARFFHFMVEIFIKHVLGVGTDHRGFYGQTAAYYGTVEQQGRLTLHLHLLLCLRGVLSPQEIRDRLMDPNSTFQNKMVEYLESVHAGEFQTGTMEQVDAKIKEKQSSANYQDPTQTLPTPPPPLLHTEKNLRSAFDQLLLLGFFVIIVWRSSPSDDPRRLSLFDLLVISLFPPSLHPWIISSLSMSQVLQVRRLRPHWLLPLHHQPLPLPLRPSFV